jgi:hypothetical protein
MYTNEFGKGICRGNHGEPGQFMVEKAFAGSQVRYYAFCGNRDPSSRCIRQGIEKSIHGQFIDRFGT